MIIRTHWYRRNYTQFRNITYSNRFDLVAQLAERWTSIPKVAGSIPTVVRPTFQPARCGYTLRVTSETSKFICFKINKFKYLHSNDVQCGKFSIVLLE